MQVVERAVVPANEITIILGALNALKRGDASVRLPADWPGALGRVADVFNDVVERNERMARELERLSRVVGKEGRLGKRGTLGDVQNTGYRAPIVPGQPACLLYAHERYGSGRLSRKQVLAPAIRLAEEGFAVDPYQAQTIAFAHRRLRTYPETVRTFFMPDGTPPEKGPAVICPSDAEGARAR